MKDFVKLLERYDYLICDYATKNEVLKLRNEFPWLKIKVVTVNEVIAMFLGKLDEEILIELIAKYDFNLEHAKIIQENLIFPHTTSFNKKTSELSTIRRQLISDGYITVDEYASFAFANKDVLILDYLRDHSLLNELLLTANVNVTYFTKDYNYIPKLYAFKSDVEEVYYVLNSIAALLNNGVLARNIIVLRPQTNYLNLLFALAPQFNIVFQNEGKPLLSFPEVKSIVQSLEQKEITISELLEGSDKEDLSPVLISFYNAFSTIDFNKLPAKFHIEYIKSVLQKTNFSVTVNDGIKIVNELPQYDFADKHYFFLDFSQTTAPVVPRGSRLLTAEEIKELGMLPVDKEALINERQMVKALTNLRNLTLSYSYIANNEKNDVSPLANALGLEKELITIPTSFYSHEYINYLTGLYKDQYRYYNIISDELNLLEHANPNSNEFKKFDFRFKGINYEHQLPLKLSFSSYDDFINLPFDYFAKYILKIVESGSYALDYGNFVHKVLEESIDEESFERNFHYYIDKYDFTVKDKFFVMHQKPIVKENFFFLKDYLHRSNPKEVIKEEYISIPLNENVTISGKVDRIHLYERNDKKYLVVFDYKTGEAHMGTSDIEKGFHFQLPIYSVLVNNYERFKDYETVGLAMNSIKLGPFLFQDENHFKTIVDKDLKFKALLKYDISAMSAIDPTYIQSEFYIGLRVNKDGTLGKMGGKIPFEDLKEHAETKISEVATRILANDFKVEKTYITGTRTSGPYSKYVNISYVNSGINESDEGEYDE